MSLIDSIKQSAVESNSKIQTTEASQLEAILNRLFYTQHNIDLETQFINTVMTRGQETQERVGLHASALIVGDKQWCARAQVLSLIYKQVQKENTGIGLLRIFEEGNAIHEKWQRLLIRGNYAKPNTLDRTRLNSNYMVSYSPDIVCRIPEFYNGAMVGEIKSVNTFQFKKMSEHPSAKKQLQLYMYLLMQDKISKGVYNGTDYKKGFVLCEDKNTQEFKVYVYDFDNEFIQPYLERMEEVKVYYSDFKANNTLPKRCVDCTSPTCKRALDCNMVNACFNVGFGRVKI
jgi:hypothetical protein